LSSTARGLSDSSLKLRGFIKDPLVERPIFSKINPRIFSEKSEKPPVVGNENLINPRYRKKRVFDKPPELREKMR